MNLQTIVAYLSAQLPGVKVGGAVEADAAMSNSTPITPALYVIEQSNTAEPNTLLGSHEQAISVSFSVLMVVANRRDVQGNAAGEVKDSLRQQILALLPGWAPDTTNGEQIAYVGGAMVDFSAGLIWWSDEFRVTTYLRSV